MLCRQAIAPCTSQQFWGLARALSNAFMVALTGTVLLRSPCCRDTVLDFETKRL
eukprot:m.46334 g.46334  ORF g.46334 m.46334 type:complete len:54 (-) comp6294_c0_seq4:1186-1347(-)